MKSGFSNRVTLTIRKAQAGRGENPHWNDSTAKNAKVATLASPAVWRERQNPSPRITRMDTDYIPIWPPTFRGRPIRRMNTGGVTGKQRSQEAEGLQASGSRRKSYRTCRPSHPMFVRKTQPRTKSEWPKSSLGHRSTNISPKTQSWLPPKPASAKERKQSNVALPARLSLTNICVISHPRKSPLSS
jgi:hypothetical protein